MLGVEKKLVVSAVAGMLLPAAAGAALVHRYNFSGNVNDVVGSANATLVDPGSIASFSGGMLNLPNTGTTSNQSPFTTGAYVDLPNGIISSLGNQATFETWITMNSNRDWAEMFSFGTSDAGEDQSSGAGNSRYITLIPQNGATHVLRLTHRSIGGPGDPAESFVDGASALSTGTEHQVVAVWNETDTTDGPTGTQYLYLDGALVGHSAIRAGISLATLTDVNNWLGRSQWPDPLIDAKYDDFRIFNTALSAQDVQTDFTAGPNVVGVPEPTALALAALGGMGLLLRRRRAL